MTTFSDGSGSLRHHDNWSRDADYQVVWRGGAPDPSRKAPRVPLGTANVVHRGVYPDETGYIPHTHGVFDVLVKNNYAEYGNTLAWGNKGRQIVIDGNIARFISDYSFGTEGGENIIFSNNISVNSTSGGIVSMYWGEKLLITGNQLITRHEPWDPQLSRFGKASGYLGALLRLHHGPSNPEDLYGAGTVQIQGNLFINELTSAPKGVNIQSGRDVTLTGNKFLSAPIGKGGYGKLTVIGNEFVSRLSEDTSMLRAGHLLTLVVARGNIFRREQPEERTGERERLSEKDQTPYLAFTAKSDQEQEAVAAPEEPGVSSAAISIHPNRHFLAVIEDNVVLGWKCSFYMKNGTKSVPVSCVITRNTFDGEISLNEDLAPFSTKIVDFHTSLSRSSRE